MRFKMYLCVPALSSYAVAKITVWVKGSKQ